MSSVLDQGSLRAKLHLLECHFTWQLHASDSKLLFLKDILKDIGTEEGYPWLGHIYNLQGYIDHALLDPNSDTAASARTEALRKFKMAAEAFRQIRNTISDEGPWLLVNHGNLAWLHYYMAETAESQAYVAKVEALLEDYPSPNQGELHPEVYAEKAWTFMKFREKRMEAEELFQKAIAMQPDRVEWSTSHAVALHLVSESCNLKQEEILEKFRIAQERDPENLYLAGIYLLQLSNCGKVTEAEVRGLAKRVLEKPVSSYSGFKLVLRLYRDFLSPGEAIDLATEALDRHPDERYLKYCLATSYTWKIFSEQDTLLRQSLLNRAIMLFEELHSQYSNAHLRSKLILANLYAQSTQHKNELADQIYQDFLGANLGPAECQQIYNSYAKYLNYHLKEGYRSIKYHMKAAEIPIDSPFRQNSIKILGQIRNRGRNRMCAEIAAFLENLQN